MEPESHVKKQLLEAVGSADPYEILGLEARAEATADDVKKAYRVLALKHHPDKGGDPNKFRAVSIAHSILSDPEKRAVFDQTGDVDESGEEIDEASFEQWYEYYRQLFPPITTSMIESFSEKYKGSEEERGDVLAVYDKFGGDMVKIMANVMLAEDVDYGRIEGLILTAIERGEIKATGKWASRRKPAKRRGGDRKRELNEEDDEDGEEEDEDVDDDDDEDEDEDDEDEYVEDEGENCDKQKSSPQKGAKRGNGADNKAGKSQPKPNPKAKPKAKPKGKAKSGGSDPSLEAMILSRKNSGGGIFAELAAKYGGAEPEPDIDDAEFERIRAGLFGERTSASAQDKKKPKR